MSKPPKLSDSWSTPQDVFDAIVDRFGSFDLDVCASKYNTKARDFFTVEGRFYDDREEFVQLTNKDALVSRWITEDSEPSKCWMNPPYSNVTPWLHKAREESQKGCTVVALINYDHTTKWWKTYIEDPKNDNRCYPGVTYHKWPTRITFDPPPGCVGKDGKPVKVTTNTRPSVVVIFRPTSE